MECEASNIAPLWEIYSTEVKSWTGFYEIATDNATLSKDPKFSVSFNGFNVSYTSSEEMNGTVSVYGDERNLIYETKDDSMKMIQNAALYVLAFNCGIIVYWFAQYKPIFNDFRTNHGAKNVNGERNGQPRIQNCIFGKNVGLNRFIILVTFLSKIILPFVDSITGKSKRHTFFDNVQSSIALDTFLISFFQMEVIIYQFPTE